MFAYNRMCNDTVLKSERKCSENLWKAIDCCWNVGMYSNTQNVRRTQKKKEKKEAKDFVCSYTDMLFCYLIEVCSRITSGWKSLYIQGLLRVMSFSVRSKIHICLPFQKCSLHFYVGSTSDEHSMSRRLFYYFLVSWNKRPHSSSTYYRSTFYEVLCLRPIALSTAMFDALLFQRIHTSRIFTYLHPKCPMSAVKFIFSANRHVIISEWFETAAIINTSR